MLVGVDESGRGPLAGPVVSAAVCLRRKTFRNRINDSKRLSALQREKAFYEIHNKAYVGLGIINESVIDAVNISRATFLSMERAVAHCLTKIAAAQGRTKLSNRTVCLLVDGLYFQSSLPYACRTLVNGDSRSLSIACASIVAKVTRDRILDMYDKVFPQYGFGRHKGYATRSHRLACQRFGPSMIHRATFRSSGMPEAKTEL